MARPTQGGQAATKARPSGSSTWAEGSARITFVVGALLTLPGASYLAGLHRISEQNYSTVGDDPGGDRLQPRDDAAARRADHRVRGRADMDAAGDRPRQGVGRPARAGRSRSTASGASEGHLCSRESSGCCERPDRLRGRSGRIRGPVRAAGGRARPGSPRADVRAGRASRITGSPSSLFASACARATNPLVIGGRHDGEQRQTAEHQEPGDQLADGLTRNDVPVADRGHGFDRPPHPEPHAVERLRVDDPLEHAEHDHGDGPERRRSDTPRRGAAGRGARRASRSTDRPANWATAWPSVAQFGTTVPLPARPIGPRWPAVTDPRGNPCAQTPTVKPSASARRLSSAQ